MAKAIFKCNECNEVEEVNFNIGEKPQVPKCPKCGKDMKRKMGNVEMGDVVEDEMLHLGQTMLYS